MIDLPDIVFIGRAGAGKSTCADILVKRFGYTKLAFAAPLKVGCGTETDRGLLQKVGHGVRQLHEDFWVNLFLDHYTTHLHGPVCVDDCRYPNELDRLRGEGFVAVAVLAPYSLRVSRLKANGKLQDEAQLDDVSETSLNGAQVDYAIWNEDKTTDELAQMLEQIINREQR